MVLAPQAGGGREPVEEVGVPNPVCTDPPCAGVVLRVVPSIRVPSRTGNERLTTGLTEAVFGGHSLVSVPGAVLLRLRPRAKKTSSARAPFLLLLFSSIDVSLQCSNSFAETGSDFIANHRSVGGTMGLCECQTVDHVNPASKAGLNFSLVISLLLCYYENSPLNLRTDYLYRS